MPRYDYQCKICGEFFEVVHLMSECDNPSEELIKQTTCTFVDQCKEYWYSKHGNRISPSKEDLRFERVIHAPEIQGTYGGRSLSGKEKSITIQKERKQRSRNHFKKEIYPTLPKQERKWFDKKKN